MKKLKEYLRFTLVISILFGIILPLAIGIKDFYLISFVFSPIWLIYAVILFINTFFIVGRGNLKNEEGIERRNNQ